MIHEFFLISEILTRIARMAAAVGLYSIQKTLIVVWGPFQITCICSL